MTTVYCRFHSNKTKIYMKSKSCSSFEKIVGTDSRRKQLNSWLQIVIQSFFCPIFRHPYFLFLKNPDGQNNAHLAHLLPAPLIWWWIINTLTKLFWTAHRWIAFHWNDQCGFKSTWHINRIFFSSQLNFLGVLVHEFS